MYASDYRRIARDALRGKWKRMAVMLLLAGLLGATGGITLGSGFNFSVNVNLNDAASAELRRMMRAMSGVSVLISLWTLFMGSWVNVGLYGMGSRVLDGESPRAGMLFPRGVFWKSVGMNLMRTLIVLLWSLLLVIPGIVAAYRYAMADYILYRHPEMGVMDVLRESKRCMQGRKGRLFFLHLSFLGWMLLIIVPFDVLVIVLGFWMGSAGNVPPAVVLGLTMLVMLAMSVANLFLDAYMHMADVAFLRDAERAQNSQQGWDENQARRDGAGDVGYGPEDAPDADGPAYSYADETAARELFTQYGCSRNRMRDAGVLEQYEAYHVDASSEQLWLQRYGNALIVRFSNDPGTLDEILELAAEYAMDTLLIRALERIDRHIRRQTLPDTEILNMAGRVLALVVSGTFDEHPDFVQRRREQVSDMADRLEARLREQDGDGGWQRTLALVRQMCGQG